MVDKCLYYMYYKIGIACTKKHNLLYEKGEEKIKTEEKGNGEFILSKYEINSYHKF